MGAKAAASDANPIFSRKCSRNKPMRLRCQREWNDPQTIMTITRIASSMKLQALDPPS